MSKLWSKILRTPVVTEGPRWTDDEVVLEAVVLQIEQRARKLFGRSLHIRQVDAGSCNGCELEINGLNGPHYDLERFGMHFVASPRHADCLLVTGPVTRNMADPLRRTYEATPHPKLVIAVGDCGLNCGVFSQAYGVAGAVSAIIPVDAAVPGCPPPPGRILAGILAALDKKV